MARKPSRAPAGRGETDLDSVRAELAETRHRLEEAEQALEAIRTGQVESLIVEGPDGPRVFSLEGSDHSYRVLVEAMNEGAAVLADDGIILYCNSRFAGMLDAPLERVMGSAITRFLPAGSRCAFEALVREANGEDSRSELELVGEHGELVPAILSVSVIHDGAARRFCLTAADLRIQRRNEEIIAAERLARSVLEQSAEAIVVCDEQGRVIRASMQATELSEHNPMLMPFAVAFPVKLEGTGAGAGEELAPDGIAPLALRGEILRAAPGWLERCDGAQVHLLVSAAPLTAGFDRCVGCVITMTDISARTRAQEALAEANHRLADADRKKDEFLAMLSHELRNPLTPIKNSLYILGRAAPGGDQARRAQAVIDRQVDQLTRLVDDLLDVTRISRRKVRLTLEQLDLNELARRTVDDYQSIFERHGLTLDVALAAEAVTVSGDSARLIQVLGNLLTNALKFTSKGGTTRVSVHRDDERGQAVLRVTDTGAGMSPEMLRHAFEPFTQADRTLDRSKGGLGLGLALVKGLVEMHSGEVAATSPGLGLGAELIVRLPLDATAPVAALGDSTAPGRPRRILVIEDNVDAADSLRELLLLWDHEVDIAYTGPEGVEKARRFEPDLVLCDIGLPGMDGYEVARTIRGDDALKDVQLVALSGYAMPEDLERAAGAGFQRHLAKPTSLEKINDALNSLPRRSRTR